MGALIWVCLCCVRMAMACRPADAPRHVVSSLLLSGSLRIATWGRTHREGGGRLLLRADMGYMQSQLLDGSAVLVRAQGGRRENPLFDPLQGFYSLYFTLCVAVWLFTVGEPLELLETFFFRTERVMY